MKAGLMTVLVLLGSCYGTVRASESSEQNKDESSELKLLIQEIRELRKRVDQLEKRMPMIEGSVDMLLDPAPPKTKRIFIIPKKQKRDLGLYVFPVLDAPPLIPKSVKRD
jgi:hypothetical protein